MRTFTDSTGEQWQLEFTAQSLVDVLDELGYSIEDGIESMPVGPKHMVALLAVLLRDQINARKLTDRQFGQRLGGMAYKKAQDCLLYELADFLSHLRPAYAALLRRVVEEEEKREPKMIEVALEASSRHYFSSEACVE